MRILGIETSCDETAAAVVEYKNRKFKVLSNIVASQIKIHQKMGGVVPEVAAREHVNSILPVIDKALGGKIDRIAVTVGPGLITSLLVGLETARTLAYLWQKPIVQINHLEAHIAAVYLLNRTIRYPALALLVSGGHTELILIKNKKYKLIGSTRDDAAGECFDKCGRILGLLYPGGPAVAKLAAQGRNKIAFPRPMINSPDFDFSFSGLKTHLLYHYAKLKKRYSLADICASLQEAIVDVLLAKSKKAAEKYQPETVILCGGVAANQRLRKKFQKNFKNFLVPKIEYCTDNAAMVAAAAYNKKPVPWSKLKVRPNAIIK